MTEREWLEAMDPQPMLDFLRTTGRLSDRKARLVAVACCKRIWPLLTDERSRRAVEVAERYADGLATSKERDTAREEARIAGTDDLNATKMAATRAVWEAGSPGGRNFWGVAYGAARAAAGAVAEEAAWIAYFCPTEGAAGNTSSACSAASAAKLAERAAQADLLRDIFPNPFRPLPTLDAAVLAWNSGAVVQLACDIYEANAWERMPELGLMMEQAGCKDQNIVGHCRQQGQIHARGCWLVDRLLGRG